MFNNPFIIFYTFLALSALVYFIFFFPKQNCDNDLNDTIKNSSKDNLTTIISKLHFDKTQERIKSAMQLLENNNYKFDYIINLPIDIELIETDSCLVIKGFAKSIGEICDDIALFNELPEGFCMQLGDWRFYVLDDITQSEREQKIVVMPPYHWLFMSCKFRDSILGYDIHPFHYFYEPITFKKVLDYGIGVEATDLDIKPE